MAGPYTSKMVFKGAITDTSTVSDTIGELGDLRIEGGKKYRLCKSGATIAAADKWLMLDTDSDYHSVKPLAAHTNTMFAVNDSGASLAADTYFWALVEGPLTIVSEDHDQADIAAGVPLMLDSEEYVAACADGATAGVQLKFASTIAAINSEDDGNVIWVRTLGA